jgi:hypothetical protein
VACGDEPAHVDDSVLFCRHSHAVGELEHFAYYFLDGLVGISFLTRLDEVGVFGKACRVEDYAQAVAVGEFADGAEVGHGNRLAACGVVRHRYDDKRHVAGVLAHGFFEFFDVDVAFERVFELGILGFIDSAVNSKSLAAFNVPFGGVEMGVARHHMPLFDEGAEKHVFGGTPLVGRYYQGEPCDAFNGVPHVEERAGAGITFVACHHGGPLAVAHGAGAGVG